MRGSIGVSAEEGLARSIVADAAGDENNALYDKTLSRVAGHLTQSLGYWCSYPVLVQSLNHFRRVWYAS